QLLSASRPCGSICDGRARATRMRSLPGIRAILTSRATWAGRCTARSTSRAMTGYVLAKDAWGRGYATEALSAMVGVAKNSGLRRLYALCHHEHRASARVLEKCDFAREGVLRAHVAFPNLIPVEPQDVACYAILL